MHDFFLCEPILVGILFHYHHSKPPPADLPNESLAAEVGYFTVTYVGVHTIGTMRYRARSSTDVTGNCLQRLPRVYRITTRILYGVSTGLFGNLWESLGIEGQPAPARSHDLLRCGCWLGCGPPTQTGNRCRAKPHRGTPRRWPLLALAWVPRTVTTSSNAPFVASSAAPPRRRTPNEYRCAGSTRRRGGRAS